MGLMSHEEGNTRGNRAVIRSSDESSEVRDIDSDTEFMALVVTESVPAPAQASTLTFPPPKAGHVVRIIQEPEARPKPSAAPRRRPAWQIGGPADADTSTDAGTTFSIATEESLDAEMVDDITACYREGERKIWRHGRYAGRSYLESLDDREFTQSYVKQVIEGNVNPNPTAVGV